MLLPQFHDSPFQLKLSFHKIIERYEDIAATDAGFNGQYAKAILQKLAGHPELKDGITDITQISENAGLIAELLAELFPAVLTKNEIKAVSIPYQALIFNHSDRFKTILRDAGPSFEINIRDFDAHQFYVLSCCLILNRFYNTNLDFAKPLFYDIPTAEGYTKHYRILYNADFMEIIPTQNSVKLSQDDIDLLMDNYDDLALWKEKFPNDGWIMKGFTIMTLIDVTVENAVSILKSNLIGAAAETDLSKNIEEIFKSIFRIADLQIGFTYYNADEGKFTHAPLGKKFNSFLLHYQKEEAHEKLLCDESNENLMRQHTYFAVSDVPASLALDPENKLLQTFSRQNIMSFILAPVVKNGALLGVLELVSPRTKELNSVTANKFDNVLPYITDSIDRRVTAIQNGIRAIIQENYTTLHPSVYWKFKAEAQNYMAGLQAGVSYTLNEIAFADVYPLYGQVDIKDSSITRNQAVKDDLLAQLTQLIGILQQLAGYPPIAAAAENLTDLQMFVDELSADIKADTEQHIQHYLETHIYPLIISPNVYNIEQQGSIDSYFNQLDACSGDFHFNRRRYETTLSLVNDTLIGILDKRQSEVQAYLPHYYERFKTDGVEHSLYVGASINQNKNFSLTDLRRLRLWELMVIAEMEIEQHKLRPALPYHLSVASLVLVFGAPISIRFRMDEKHFDIDGAYNIRYEVIKKRIDKAHIKNSNERITRKGKITIVYTSPEEETEYLQYIKILQTEGILEYKVEHFNVEELQAVSGLKGMRIGVLHNRISPIDTNTYSTIYNSLTD